MAEYFVIKQEQCPVNFGTGGDHDGCRNCRGLGYTAVQVPLLDVLKQLRWTSQVPVPREYGRPSEQTFKNLRLDGEE